MPSVEIRVDGVDITDDVIIESATFTSQANGGVGTASLRIKDVPHVYAIVTGSRMTVDIGGLRHWTGYVTQVMRVYAFPAASNNPAHARLFQINGADINILFVKRIVFNQADPTIIESPLYGAGTADTTVLDDLFDDWLDLSGDDLDTTTFIENVADINLDQGARPWSGSYQWGQAMASIASLPGAVYYIDPDRNVVWTDVDTPNAPAVLSDRPTAGQVGYREMELLKDGTRLINDYLAIGFGYGSSTPVYSREISAASVATHGLWQASTLAYGVFRQGTIDRIAESVVFGSPSNHRGSKDDRVSVRLTIFEPGFRVAMKATFESEVFGFTDVIPIRQQTITFDGPTSPRFQMLLSHEIDPPWGFIDTIGLPDIGIPGIDIDIDIHGPESHYDHPVDPDPGTLPHFIGDTGDADDWAGIPWIAHLETPVRGDEAGPRVWFVRGYASPVEIWEPYEVKVNPEDTYTGIRFLFPQTITIIGALSAATVTAGDAFLRVEIVLAHGGDVDDEDVVATWDTPVSSGGLRFFGDTAHFTIEDIDVEDGDTIRINVGIQGLVLIARPSGRIGFFQAGWVNMYRAGFQGEQERGETQDEFSGDGSTQTFETAQGFEGGSVTVTINGITQNDFSTDYQNHTVSLPFAPGPEDQVVIKYNVEE